MLGFDVPTFVFQVVNFLILLAVLSRFFYRPVLDIMQRRQAVINDRIQDAEQRAQQADAERAQLAQQSQTATRDAAAVVEAAHAEAARERQRLLEDAKREAASLIAESRKTAAAEQEAALARLSAHLTQTALNVAGSLVRATAGAEVHAGLIERLLDQGLSLDDESCRAARLTIQDGAQAVVVESAYPLDATSKERLGAAAARILARTPESLQLEYRDEPALLAGARVVVGALVVDLSLRHQLEELAASTPAAGDS